MPAFATLGAEELEQAGRTFTATVTAETDVKCLALSAWDFRALVERYPTIGARLAAVASERLGGDSTA